MKTIRCILKEGKERPLEGFHPWIFSGALDQIDDSFEPGDLVRVFSSEEKFLGIGYLNPHSQIAIRMLTFEEEAINESFFERRILKAAALRGRFFDERTNAFRLIHSEGDFLPGLIVDRYAGYLVLQILTAGMEKWRDVIVSILQKEFNPAGIYEKDESDWRTTEGLQKRMGRLAGSEPPDFVEILENGLGFIVDIHGGQKTGFFLDQRESRRRAGELSSGRRVLNCFAYTGGFSLYAAAGGARETVSVESSEPALNTARVHFERNGLAGPAHTFVREDVFDYLRASRQEFDMIILDPPAFCKGRHQIQPASRGYKDINLWAMKRLAPEGLLFTFSCSSHIEPDLFQKIIFGAAKDARKPVRILAKTSHPPDHPISIFHPEGEYLKGLLCQVG